LDSDVRNKFAVLEGLLPDVAIKFCKIKVTLCLLLIMHHGHKGAFLTWTLTVNRSECLDSRLGRFIPSRREHRAYWISGWKDIITGLEVAVNPAKHYWTPSFKKKALSTIRLHDWIYRNLRNGGVPLSASK
jgi:hypothetical protein